MGGHRPIVSSLQMVWGWLFMSSPHEKTHQLEQGLLLLFLRSLGPISAFDKRIHMLVLIRLND